MAITLARRTLFLVIWVVSAYHSSLASFSSGASSAQTLRPISVEPPPTHETKKQYFSGTCIAKHRDVPAFIAVYPFHCWQRAHHPAVGSMARVYADVNQQMPRSYWDYDSVNISWGVLENYEVVRKIGRQNLGFQSCLRGTQHALTARYRQGQIFGSFRGHKCCQLPKMRHQSSQACEEKENKAGDQDIAKSVWGSEYRCAA